MPVATTERVTSPLDNLLSMFSNQNEQFENLVSRLASVGHKLSDTNSVAEKSVEGKPEPLPFEQGSLRVLYDCLTRENYHIQNLRTLIEKLESLV